MKQGQPPSLLLLPPPPHPVDRPAINAAYRPAIEDVITKLKGSGGAGGSTLIIALAAPFLAGNFRKHKSLSWDEAQAVLAGMYSLVAAVCARLRVATEVDGGEGAVDARVVLVDHNIKKALPMDFKVAVETNNTVVVDLATFVAAYHPWQYIFSVGSEYGHQVLSQYLTMFEGTQVLTQEQLITVQGGLTLNAQPADTTQLQRPAPLHNVVCLGGTFDHLHPGHKLLLTAAILLLKVPEEGCAKPCTFVIGVTGDELLKNKKYAEHVQPWDDRAMGVIEFLASMLELQKHGWKGERSPKVSKKDGEILASFRSDTIAVQCVCIQDPFGPTVTQEDMDALVVSGETRSGGAAVNEKRAELGWRQLEVFEVDVLDAEDVAEGATKTENFASKISSSAIRQLRAESRM